MHVLGLPPAFVLSQDQTLRFHVRFWICIPDEPECALRNGSHHALNSRLDNLESKGVGLKRRLARVSCDPSEDESARTPPPAFLFLRFTCQRALWSRRFPPRDQQGPCLGTTRTYLRVRLGSDPAGVQRVCPKARERSQRPRSVRGINQSSFPMSTPISRFFLRSTESGQNAGKYGLNTMLPDYDGGLVKARTGDEKSLIRQSLAAAGRARLGLSARAGGADARSVAGRRVKPTNWRQRVGG